jgi:hypothetical protein
MLENIQRTGKCWQEIRKEEVWEEGRDCRLFIHQPMRKRNEDRER